MTFPQLRVRTEFSYRQAFGPINEVAAALAALKCPSAGIVDGGTWGHVKWEKACSKAGITPLFGCEVEVEMPDGRKPKAWALAADTKAFYEFSTAARAYSAVDANTLFRQAGEGVIRFAGAALTDPDTFDYVDLNPASPLAQRAALRLAKHTGKPLVITSDNSYPTKGDYGAFLANNGRERTTPQHILTLDELRAQLTILDDTLFATALHNTHEAAERCATKLIQAPIIRVPGDLRALTLAGKEQRIRDGYIKDWTPAMEARMERELKIIAEKQFESYFIVVADLVQWAKTRMLVGPGRGSSAGSIVCYLLRITEVNPLDHDLLFERFIDINRSDLPDIDIDFSDQHRDEVFTYLGEKYGKANVARIGNINTLKPRSVMAQVSKAFGIPDRERYDVLNVLIEYSSGDSRYGKGIEDTLNNTEAGRKFASKYPEASVMYRLENHADHTGIHAAGVIVCNEPVSHYCTVNPDGVAHIDKPDSEAINLLKIDALGLRTLGVIEDAAAITNEELYRLPMTDQKVFDVFNNKRFAGLFQFEGQAQRRVSAEVNIHEFRQLDHVTALARPGPLGGGASQHYIARAAGREEVTYRHPSMKEYLSDTMGVVLYQEQVMRIVREIGQFSWADTSSIRKAMSGRKGQEYFDRYGREFVKGAATLAVPVPADEAQTIWDEICTFGSWGMNKSHTVSYAVISYWCGYMKAYHPVAYAAACLRNAKSDTQIIEILRDMEAMGVKYVPFDIERSEVNWSVKDGQLIGGFMNLDGVGPAKASKAVADRAAGTMTDEAREKLLALPVKFSELYPLRRAYGHIMDDPTLAGARDGSKIVPIDQLPDGGDVLLICKVLHREQRDENETLRLGRRGHALEGPTAFLDIMVTDDSGVPITLRIDRWNYEPYGRIANDNLLPGDALLVRGHRIPNFAMVKVERMKCLSRPEVLVTEASPEGLLKLNVRRYRARSYA